MTVTWRSYGGVRFELAAPPPIAAVARQWLGVQGWNRGAGPPGSARIRVDRAGTGLHCTAPSLGEPLSGSVAGVLGELEWRCTNAALARCRAPAALHAALVAGRRASVILIGRHTGGKTTLGLALAERGLNLLGDDVVLLDSAGVARALPRPLRIRVPTLHLLGRLRRNIQSRAVFDRLEGIYRVDPALVTGGGTRAPPVRDVVFVRYARRARARLRLRRDSPSGAIDAALRHTFAVRSRDARTAAAVIALVARARVWTFDYSASPQAAAQKLLSTLGLHALR